MDSNTSDTSTTPKKGEESLSDEADQALAGWIEQENAANLVPFFLGVEDFGPKFLQKLSEQVISDKTSGWESSEGYRDKRRENYQLLTGTLPKKSFPWDGCANVHIPIMLERYLRLTANVFVELFSDRDAFYNVSPTGPDDQETAEILTLHGNWQFKNELTDFTRQQARGIGEFFGAGSVYAYSYRDTVKNRNRHDTLNCEELVIPFVWTTVETDMSDVPYKIRILRKYRAELEQMKRQGEWEQVQALLDKGPPAWDVMDTKVRDKAAQGEGIIAPEQNKRAPWILFEYHGYYRMPGEDRQRPICATVDLNSKAVVKLYLREEEDWRDRMRFDRQTQELQAHQQATMQFQTDMQAFQQVQAQEQALHEAMAQPHVDPAEADIVRQALEQQRPEPPQPPVPPRWLKEGMTAPEPVRKIPIEQFSHGVCFENPNGTMGLSPGMILADLNRVGDEAANRFYDAATLANIWAVVVPESFDLGSSTVPMQPGKVIKVKNMSGEQIKNAIHEFRAAAANPQLLDLIRMAEESADSSVAAPGVLSGEPGKSGETFRGQAMRSERASRQLSQAGLMYMDFLTNILRNNARLNALFMPDEEILAVGSQFLEARKYTLGADGQPLPELRISRDMYRRDYRVTFAADVRFSSQEQKIGQVDEVLAMIGQIPPLQQNYALLHATVSKALRLRGQSDLIPKLGPAPPDPKTPMGAPPPGPPPPGAPPPPGTPPPGAGGPPPGGPQ